MFTPTYKSPVRYYLRNEQGLYFRTLEVMTASGTLISLRTPCGSRNARSSSKAFRMTTAST